MAQTASDDDDAAYREMMAKISKRVDEYTLEELKYQCRDLVGPGRLEKATTCQALFELLEERDEINIDDVEFLHKILKNVDRIDLCKVVKAYEDTRHRDAMSTSTASHQTTEPVSNNVPNDPQLPVPIQGATHLPTVLPKSNFHPAGKSFSLSDVEPDKKKTTQMTVQGKPSGRNYSEPFDTSGNSMGGFRINPQPASIPPRSGGYAISPQLMTALEYVISSISRGWQSAARRLGVSDVIIDHAEENWPRNIRNQIDETFRYWVRNDREASLPKLVTALRHVGRNDLADDLEYGQY